MAVALVSTSSCAASAAFGRTAKEATAQAVAMVTAAEAVEGLVARWARATAAATAPKRRRGRRRAWRSCGWQWGAGRKEGRWRTDGGRRRWSWSAR